jgi:UDP-N-acetyl-D-glucosamine dehydrogenase
VEKVQNALNDASKSVRGSHVHLLGTAYKKNIDDVRESPALDIILLLQRLGATVTYSDPFIRKININGSTLESQDLLPSVEKADCVVVVTDHSGVDYGAVVERCKRVVDTRNALRGLKSDKIVRL